MLDKSLFLGMVTLVIVRVHMVHFIPLHQAQGTITIQANGVTYRAPIRTDDVFAHELTRAIVRGHNPAEAFLFLAQLAAKNCHPHHCQSLGHRDREMWHELFGPSIENPLPSDGDGIVHL